MIFLKGIFLKHSECITKSTGGKAGEQVNMHVKNPDEAYMCIDIKMHMCMSTHMHAHKIVVHESFISLLHFFLQNPLQVVVNAIINSGPREDSTRIGRAGTVRRQAVDVSPLRRVNQAMWLLCTGAREAAFRNIKTIAECLADELINAAKVAILVSMLRPLCFNIMTIADCKKCET